MKARFTWTENGIAFLVVAARKPPGSGPAELLLMDGIRFRPARRFANRHYEDR